MEIKISLAAARINANLTQQEVAERMKVSKSTVINWEKGKSSLKPSDLYYLSRIYDIPVENIFLPERLTES